MRLLFTVLGLPFWAFLIVAAGFVFLGELSYRDTLAKNQEMERARAGSPPETVDFADFSRDANIGLADEVSVRAVINPDYNYRLTKQRKGPDTVRHMYVLFDAADPQSSKLARGALVLTPAEKAKFVEEYFEENAELKFVGEEIATVITLNGLAENRSDLSSLVKDSFKDEGLKKSDDFIYIEPFLEGREVGLTPTMTADEMRNILRGIALVLALIGAVKFLRRRMAPASLPATRPVDATVPDPFAANVSATASPAGFAVPAAPADATVGQDAPKRGYRRLIGVLGAVAIIGVLAFSGYLVLAIIAGLLGLQFFAIRKTRGLIMKGLSRFGLLAPQTEKKPSAVSAALNDLPDDFPGAFSGFGLKRKASAGTPAQETPQPAPMTKTPKSALDLDADEKQGFSLQMLLARLSPAPREPKVFADRPDPFDKLAAEVRRSAVN